MRETVKKLADLGVKHILCAPVRADGEGVGMKNEILSTEEAYNAMIDYIPQYIADGAPIKIGLMGIFKMVNPSEYKIPLAHAPENANIDKIYVCHSIRKSFHIDFEGFVMPCPPNGL